MKAKTDTNTKELFLQTASSLFANKGYHATGISEILKQSQAPKGSLYYYFPQGKEQLADEALQSAEQEITRDISSFLSEEQDAIKAFQKHLLFIAKKIEQDMFRPNVSISLIALETFSSSERIRKRCEQIFAQIENLYRQKLLQEHFSPEVANTLAMTMVMLTEGAITLSLTRKNTSPLHNLAENLPQLLNLK